MNNRKKRINRKQMGFTSKKTIVYSFLAIFVLFCVIFISYAIKIFCLDRVHGEEYQKKIMGNQSYVSNSIPYKRGDIVDVNGNKLAVSKKVYNLILDPSKISKDEKYISECKNVLSKCFQISGDRVDDILSENKKSKYYPIKECKGLSKKEKEDYEKVREEEIEKDSDNKTSLDGIWFEEEYKREYPYSTVACDVIGFCTEVNSGSWGIEKEYNDQLNGTTGRRYGYYDSELNLVQTVKAATDGYTIRSTIDVNVQGILEQHIQKYMKNIGAKKIACILMDPNTGGIVAMASNSVFDLNDPRNLTYMYSQEEIDKMDDQQKVEALNTLWRNFCISDAYEPGSTFKPITVSACLDEGTTSKTRYYVCDGGQQVSDRYIKCVAYNAGGHGSLTIRQALMVSCNDVLMQLAAGLGKTKFLQYVNRFGFGKKTGIDLPGEATGTIFNMDNMHEVELATSSFGQGQTVTMVQMAAAFSSVVNGGKYYQPHVVEEITSDSGAIVQSNDNLLEGKVITEDTSKTLRKYLLDTVEEGTANPASVKGYKIGGKTGTAEKVPRGQGKYLVSFIGCVPANNPKLVAYVVIDEPNVEDQAHSTYATEFTSDLFKDVLPLLGIYPSKKGSNVEKAEEKISKRKIKLPSTKNGNMIEAPDGGYSNEEYGVAETDADNSNQNTGVSQEEKTEEAEPATSTEDTDTEDSDSEETNTAGGYADIEE